MQNSVMGRIAMIVAVGYPHHATQRGNERADATINPVAEELI
jgi:hypothetical protein